MLALLWVTFFLHQADRQIYNNLLPLIRADLRLDNVQLGLVASVFTAAYGLCVMVGGYAGDVLRRKWIVIVSLLVWSGATLLTGLSSSVVALMIFRGLATGGGEAFYYPAAASLISQCHRHSRATALAIHQSALYVGIVASFLAGYVGERYGWRNAFYVFGGCGMGLGAILLMRLQDTPRNNAGASTTNVPPPGPPLPLVLRTLFRTPTALWLCAAFAADVFVVIGYATWMPTFMHERYGMSVTAAGFAALASHHAAAIVGAILGGTLSDRWAARRRSVRMEFESLGLLDGAPLIVWMGYAGSVPTCCTALALFGLFRGIYDSNLWAAMFDVVEPRYRASATGLMLSCAFLVGAIAPVLMGWMKGFVGLSTAIASLGAVYFAGGVIVLVALGTSFAKDYCQE
jgi:sugar phosphate permease